MRWLAVGLDNHAIAGKLKIGDRAVSARFEIAAAARKKFVILVLRAKAARCFSQR